jgi:hypothetical protein
MRRYSVALIALFLVPTLAQAQRKMRGEPEANWKEIDRSVQANVRISKGDLEKLSAIRTVAEKKKDLRLTAEQLAKIDELTKQEASVMEPHFKLVDSLKLAARWRQGQDSTQERARTTLARQELMSAVRVIRSTYDSTFQFALPVLDETQQKAVAEHVQKEREDADEEIQKALGGRGGRSTSSDRVPFTTTRRP